MAPISRRGWESMWPLRASHRQHRPWGFPPSAPVTWRLFWWSRACACGLWSSPVSSPAAWSLSLIVSRLTPQQWRISSVRCPFTARATYKHARMYCCSPWVRPLARTSSGITHRPRKMRPISYGPRLRASAVTASWTWDANPRTWAWLTWAETAGRGWRATARPSRWSAKAGGRRCRVCSYTESKFPTPARQVVGHYALGLPSKGNTIFLIKS